MVIWDQANTLLPFLLAPLGNVVENPCFPLDYFNVWHTCSNLYMDCQKI